MPCVEYSWFCYEPDVAPNGAARALFGRGYGDFLFGEPLRGLGPFGQGRVEGG
jgi:hypothetical protein